MTDRPRMPFVLTIDAEPDSPWPGLHQNDPWMGFESWAAYAGELRERLSAATGQPVHFTWVLRMDEQVGRIYGSPTFVADHYAAVLAKLTEAGDALGVHPHAWRWQDPPGAWLQDHADDAWCAQVIDTSFAAYAASFGKPPAVHRFGSRFISPAIVHQVERLGCRVDTTVEPGARGMIALGKTVWATGYLPDQTHAPRGLYQPAAEDPLRPASSPAPKGDGLWILPSTAIDPAPLLPAWRRHARRARYLARPRHRPAELWAPFDPPAFWGLVWAAADSLDAPFVSLAVRSESLLGRHATAIKAKLDALLAHPLKDRVAFTTAPEAVDQLIGGQ